MRNSPNKRIAASIIAVLLATLLTAATSGPASALLAPTASPGDEPAFVSMINAERTAAGLAPLIVDGGMTNAARGWALEMAIGDFLAHAPDISTGLPAGWTGGGENVGVGGTVGGLHNAFMNSPGHKANIMDPAYNVIGVGVYTDGGTMYTTHRFGTVPGYGGAAPTPVPATATPVPYIPPTATPVPYIPPTATPVPYIPPTATPVPYIPPTATPVPYIPPTATPVPYIPPTATPVPPTATPVPYVPPTATAVPIIPTSTPVPATATAVPIIPTSTPVPATATAVPTIPTSTPVPATATAVPIIPTSTTVPATATAVPVQPTAVPVQPTAIPAASDPAGDAPESLAFTDKLIDGHSNAEVTKEVEAVLNNSVALLRQLLTNR